MVQAFQLSLDFWLFLQDTFLDDLIHRGGRQRQSGLEAGLNPGKLISADFDDLVDGFLTGAHHPDLAAALAADFLGQ